MMQILTHDECMTLLAGIQAAPPGDWTHDLITILDGPARFITRAVIPDGQEVVYFRHPDGAGAWPAANWDRFALARVPQQVEQMTLF
ncbi:hypothetical protein [Paenibacillus phocaensis]|uniref:hypothetical protein n=1 Tax=Paenibacillus phocaensis TaxID=1776378 RepID=UPI0018E1EF85|nr:hypothetical protein [Paenibacillus phocaensis]